MFSASLANPKPRSGGVAAVAYTHYCAYTPLSSSAVFAVVFYVFMPGGQHKLLSLLFLGASVCRARLALTCSPRFDWRFRALEAAAAGGLFFSSLVLVVRVHHDATSAPADTLALAIGVPVGALAFALASAFLHLQDVMVAGEVLTQTRLAEEEGKGVTAAALHLTVKFKSPKQARARVATGAKGRVLWMNGAWLCAEYRSF